MSVITRHEEKVQNARDTIDALTTIEIALLMHPRRDTNAIVRDVSRRIRGRVSGKRNKRLLKMWSKSSVAYFSFIVVLNNIKGGLHDIY